jgi:hypothetical protein
MLHQGCFFEFFRLQSSPFYFFSTNTFLSVVGIHIILNALYYFYKIFFKGSLNIAKEQKFYIFEKNKHTITLTEKRLR